MLESSWVQCNLLQLSWGLGNNINMETDNSDKKESSIEKIANTLSDNYTNAKNPLKQIILNNFLGGIAWALGISLGASLILAVFGFVFSKVNLIPIVGKFVIEVNKFIAENGQAFIK